MTHELETYGLILLFLLVAVEGCGVPVPGETALITAAVLAGGGQFVIWEVIGVAACGAVVGDNTGYAIARLGGRRLLRRIPVVRNGLERFLPVGERFFERHGPKALVVARFVVGLRVTAAWLAGLSHMRWNRFAVYNACGGLLWATAIGMVAYVFGRAAVNAVTHYGFYAAVVFVVAGLAGIAGFRIIRGRREQRRIDTNRIYSAESLSDECAGDMNGNT